MNVSAGNFTVLDLSDPNNVQESSFVLENDPDLKRVTFARSLPQGSHQPWIALVISYNRVVVLDYVTQKVIFNQVVTSLPPRSSAYSLVNFTIVGDFLVAVTDTYPAWSSIWKLNRVTGLLELRHNAAEPDKSASNPKYLRFSELVDHERLLMAFMNRADAGKPDDVHSGFGCHILDLERGTLSDELYRLPAMTSARTFFGGIPPHNKVVFVPERQDGKTDHVSAVVLDVEKGEFRRTSVSFPNPFDPSRPAVRTSGILQNRLLYTIKSPSDMDGSNMRFYTILLNEHEQNQQDKLAEVDGTKFSASYELDDGITDLCDVEFLADGSFVTCTLQLFSHVTFQFCKIVPPESPDKQ
jgi:hypothetical protein